MLSPGEAPVRRAPLHAPAAVSTATNADALPEEKHQHDKHHCMLQQQSATPPTPMPSPRRSTSRTSTTACSSSSHHRDQRRCSPRGEALARRALPHAPAAVIIATTADALPEEKHLHDEHYCMLQQQSSSLTKPMLPPRRGPARRSPLQPAAATILHCGHSSKPRPYQSNATNHRACVCWCS